MRSVSAAWLLLMIGWTECKTRYMPKTVPILSQANNEFALALYKAVPHEGNVVFSPWSIMFSLGMVMLGAEGATLQEMKKSMFVEDTDPENIHYGFKQLREHLVRHKQDYEMSMFSTILVQHRLGISPVYKLKLQRYYDADIHEVDFVEHSKLVFEWINVWTSLRTSGKITEVLTAAPKPDTVMMLLTTSYFKGIWEETFSLNATKKTVFHNADGTQSKIDMMFATRNMSVYTGEDLSVNAVHLPMKGDVGFLFMRPNNAGEIEDLEKSISTQFFDKLFDDISEEPVQLGLPKFKAEGKLDLEEPLQSLGMKTLFSYGSQLTGISNSGALSVQEIMHQSVLEIDEQGATAASVTLVGIASRHKAYKLNFDSPFLFLVRDTKSGVILYMGKVSQL